MAAKKDKIVEEYKNAPAKVGDWLKTMESKIYGKTYNDKEITVEVLEVLSDGRVKVKPLEGSSYKIHSSTISDGDYTKNFHRIGENPFPKNSWRRSLQTGNYMLESIIHKCGIEQKDETYKKPQYEIGGITVPELNWNPYVFNKDGEKEYYQRDYCWTLKDEQLFIESIYNYINCGLVIVRRRSWKWLEKQIASGNKEVAFNDIVDGKQRMHILDRFVNDEFQDLHGNYFSDLSNQAQYEFMNSNSLQFAMFEEDVTDDMIISAFLNVNFTGVPMPQEHIDYVKEIQKKM